MEKPLTEAFGSRIPTVDELLTHPRDLTISMHWGHQMNLENWYDIIIKAVSLAPPPTNQYFMTLPVGDFSMDGLMICEEFLVRADKPYQDVRDAHFRIEEVTGIDLHGFANEDSDDIIP